MQIGEVQLVASSLTIIPHQINIDVLDIILKPLICNLSMKIKNFLSWKFSYFFQERQLN